MDTKTIQKTLEKIARLHKAKYRKKLFCCVCACDMIPKKIPKSNSAIIIVNSDTSDKPGTHWLAIWITTSKRQRLAYFFDSYGRAPLNTYIRNFIKDHSNKISWNVKQIQSLHTHTCGEYCCVFALSMAASKSFTCFFRQFDNDFDANDEKIHHLYNCNFNKTMTKRGEKQICNQRCKSFNECLGSSKSCSE